MRWFLANIWGDIVKILNCFFLSLKIAIRSTSEGRIKEHRVGIYGCKFLIGIFISIYRRLFVHTQLYFNSFSFLVFEYTRSNSFYAGISHRFVL